VVAFSSVQVRKTPLSITPFLDPRPVAYPECFFQGEGGWLVKNFLSNFGVSVDAIIIMGYEA